MNYIKTLIERLKKLRIEFKIYLEQEKEEGIYIPLVCRKYSELQAMESALYVRHKELHVAMMEKSRGMDEATYLKSKWEETRAAEKKALEKIRKEEGDPNFTP